MRIAQTTGLSRATVSRILTRLNLNKARLLEPTVPILRYEHPAPGDLLHIDIKKLARIAKPGHRITGNPQDETRGAGWEFLYVAVDDHSRIAYTAMLPDEKAVSASLPRQAVAYFARFAYHRRRVLTDNGPCFYALHFAANCRDLAHHTQTHPHLHPAHQRQSRTLYPNRHPRMGLRPALPKLRRTPRHLTPWIHQYNWHRPHASLNQCPPSPAPAWMLTTS